ncbi:hypothetical protein GGF46_000551 [Coemansia sp. RSA 552]|nr:hypothetical protein GGF46_000551 [Coemansia sp. RSA 552]
MSQKDTDDGFTVVRGKGKRGRSRPSSKRSGRSGKTGGLYPAASATQRSTEPDADEMVEQQLEAVAGKRDVLRRSQFHAEFVATCIPILAAFDPQETVCYGIGSLATPVSQWQLALILLINEKLGSRIWAYDPASTTSDIATLEKLGVSTITTDEGGRRRADCRTLFFMPHCEQFLYENLLAANWTEKQLRNIALIGNHFVRYKDAQEHRLAEKAPHMDQVLPLLTVVDLPHEKLLGLRHCPYAFSDTCIQYIPPDTRISDQVIKRSI